MSATTDQPAAPPPAAAGESATASPAIPPVDRALCQEIADTALEATGARLVALSLVALDGSCARLVAQATPWSAVLQGALAVARRLLPGFDPFSMRISLRANPLLEALYRDGTPVAASFERVAVGTIDDRLLPVVGAAAGISWSYAYPLLVRGSVAGSLSFMTASQLNARARRACEAFARQAALALEHALLVEAERHRAAQAERLVAVLARLAEAPDLESAMAALLRGAVDVLGAQRGSADVYDSTTGARLYKLRLDRDADGTGSLSVTPKPGPPREEGYSRQVLTTGEPLLIADFQVMHPERADWQVRGMRAAMYVPIRLRGRVLGTFHVDHPQAGFFTSADLALAQALATDVAGAVERALLEASVRQQREERARLDGALTVARTAAHELNNALAPVVGYADLLAIQPGVQQDPLLARYTQLIIEGAHTAAVKVKRLHTAIQLDPPAEPPT